MTIMDLKSHEVFEVPSKKEIIFFPVVLENSITDRRSILWKIKFLDLLKT